MSCLRADRAGEEALAERAERNKPMPSSSSIGRTSASGSPPPQRIFALQRRHRLHGVRAADRLHAGFRHAEMLDLAFSDQVLHRAGHVLDRHVGIDAVLVEKIDDVGPEALQRRLDGLPDVLRPAVHASRLPVRAELEAELGGDHHLVAERAQALRRPTPR